MPECEVCGNDYIKIIGHGLEANGATFCCAHCSEGAGVGELRDRVEG